MRYSEDEVEKNIGIEVFLTNTNGIGGKLRASPEDFYVEEIPIYPKKEEGGKYAVAKVISKNWEANKLLNILSTTLKISRRKIYFAGTKDKRAIKSQLMVFEVDKEKLSAVKIKDIEIIPLYTTNKKIRIGELIGNNFDVTIRDLDNPAIAEDRMIEITNEIMASNGFPNFFGIQRFGAVRPITHIVGRELINGNFEKAVFTYIGNPMKNERKEAYDARKFLEETHDFSKALELYPKELYFERRIIAHLAKEPKDYANALRRLPQNLTMMFIHAYQSYLFNKILSKRIEEGIQLNKAYIGDTILPIDKYGLPNQDEIINVEKENIGKVNKKITEGKAFLSAPLFGSETKISSGIGGEIEREVIEEEGVKNEDFIISSMPEVSSKGTRRELVGIIRELDWKLVDGNLKIKFGIQRGAYATSLLREYMKTGVLSY